MKQVQQILRGLLARINTLMHFVYKTGAWWQVWLHGSGGAVASSCRFHVPVCLNGRGKVFIGEGVQLGHRLSPRLGNGMILMQARTPTAEVSIGELTSTGNNVAILACRRVAIGRKCLIGDQVAIYDSDFHAIDPQMRASGAGASEPVEIGDQVWLGSRVMVLKGVRIGHNSVVGAASVVTSSIPDNCLAAGVPARVIRRLDSPR